MVQSQRSEPVFYVALKKPVATVKGASAKLGERESIMVQIAALEDYEKTEIAKGPPPLEVFKKIQANKATLATLRARLKVVQAGIAATQPAPPPPELVDLTQSVLEFEFEESEKKTDLLKLTLENRDLRWFDSDLFEKGVKLVVTWGYVGHLAPPREVVITGVKGSKTLQIEAQSLGALMNKVARTRTFQNVTRADVVRTIADENGYGPDFRVVDDGPPSAKPPVSGAPGTYAVAMLAAARAAAASASTLSSVSGLASGPLQAAAFKNALASVQKGKATGVASGVFTNLESILLNAVEAGATESATFAAFVAAADKSKTAVEAAAAAANKAAAKPAAPASGEVPRYAVITQAGQTDAQFLKRLADLQGFEFYIDPVDGLHWHPRKVQQRPIREYEYYIGENVGDVKDFSVENDITAKPGAITVKGKDPLSKTDINATADGASTPRPMLAPVMEVVDPTTGSTEVVTSLPAVSTASSTVQPTSEPTAGAAKVAATGQFTRTQQSAILLNLELVGDPSLLAKTVIFVRGLGRRLSGRYYVFELAHKVSTSGYIMAAKCRSDGTNSRAGALAKSAGQPNTGTAPGDGDGGALTPVEIVDPVDGTTKVIYKDTRGRDLAAPAKAS